MMTLLDFSVDALVFPQQKKSQVLHLDGLREQQAEALIRLVETMKE
mgnify:FL=1